MRFLDAFAMISLGIGEAEEAFLEEVTKICLIFFYSKRKKGKEKRKRKSVLLLIPKRKRNILQVMSIRDPGDTILTPAVSSGAGMVVGKVWTKHGSAQVGNSGFIHQPSQLILGD